MENFDIKEYEKKCQFELENGISKKRKKEIRKELKTMSQEEVNHEIEELYNALTPLLYNDLNLYCDILETLLHSLLEGKYVVDISEKIDIDLKNKFNKFFKQTKLALEFAKKYFKGTLSSSSLLVLDLIFFDTNEITSKNEKKLDIDKKHLKILDECKKIEEESEELLKKYNELYLPAIKLYIDENEEYIQYVKQMDELNKKIDENNKKIPTKDELEAMLKNNNI